MLRPRWLALLALSLLVAAAFAWLGQWQLDRAIDTDPPPPGATEEVQPLAEVIEPGAYLPEPLVGQQVEAGGFWVPGDFVVIDSRYNDGVEGYWVTGQLRIGEPDPGFTPEDGSIEPTSLAVAIGWAPTRADAEAAASALDEHAAGAYASVTGRLISDEGPGLPPAGADPHVMTRMSPAALLGVWHDIEGLDVYRPYLAALAPDAGVAPQAGVDLDPIASWAPEAASPVNWLNVFYAIEWVVFAGFAFYLWYRLARDAWEKELEELEDAEDAEPAAS
ncbi:SURF1 family protein [Microbacterium sp. LRZ72]|uniref:SURF1 family cytochrome oxidase biogenesis protein n=1 Tax=Microbacterium sp. LRZ72 TaxID=2942481 RepID=UPI0029B843F9|nr:SURF1 family cytochrome oxidase biogenesis protein [Microbacterium sp. LRZ72]MDX2377242.1 SURF1 family protein [Microbacterium sp. LRZ72]